MPTNNLIARGDVAALVPEDVSNEVWELAVEQSAALSLFPQIRMASTQQRIPVLSALPTAYWVDGDTGLKQTTAQAWSNKYIDVAELAVIVPIPEAVLDDTPFNIWGEVQPRLVEAIGRKVDEAVFFGLDKPAIFPPSLREGAVEAGNSVERGSVAPGGQDLGAGGDLADDFNFLMRLLEDDGYDAENFLLSRRYRSRLRGLRDANGQLIYVPGVPDSSPDTIYGLPTSYGALRATWGADRVTTTDPTTGAVTITTPATEGFVFPSDSVVMGIRQDITYKMLTEATIHNTDGTVAFNLAQQDMVALRATFRCGFQVRDVPTPESPEFQADGDPKTRYPAAIITEPAG